MSKVDGVWKTDQDGVTSFAVNAWKYLRVLDNPFNQSRDGGRETIAKADATRLIPTACLEDLAFGLRPKD